MSLELYALDWLLYEKRCEIALRERSPRMGFCGEPDVIGLTRSRHLVEIEVKRSVSDFKRDRFKASRVRRDLFLDKLPLYFYYLVPNELLEKVQPLTPEWAGLMRGPVDGEPQAVYVVRPAPKNRNSQRLSVKECCRLVRMVANWAMSEARGRNDSLSRFRYGHSVYP